MISEYQIFQANAFVDRNCFGNPAGICLLPEEVDTQRLKKVAVIMAASQTAFLLEKDSTLRLRWFAANGIEVGLCGHATLATARVLWQQGMVNPEETISFHTMNGILPAKMEGDFVSLSFLREQVTQTRRNKYPFAELLGIEPIYIGRTRLDYFIVVATEEAVKNMAPDFAKLKRVKTRGIIVTARSDNEKYDYVVRFFAPLLGINEDPVTGSAHSYLGVYWGSVLQKKALKGYQASPEGGMVRVGIDRDRISLSGKVRMATVAGNKKREVLALLRKG